jgi:hypothetical protein
LGSDRGDVWNPAIAAESRTDKKQRKVLRALAYFSLIDYESAVPIEIADDDYHSKYLPELDMIIHLGIKAERF